MHSRGMKLIDLLSCDVYWHGPRWLKYRESHGPNSEIDFDYSNDDCVRESAKVKDCLVVAVDQRHLGHDIFERFSNYVKIVCVTARILR